MILAGHGVLFADATDELRAFAEKAQIPVAHTLLGVGAIDERAPAQRTATWACTAGSTSTGPSSRPTCSSRWACASTTASPGKVSTYAPNARIIHVDIDPSEIGKNVAVDVPIVGDVGRVLRALIAAGRRGRPGRRAPTTSPSWPSGAPSPSQPAGTARARWRDGLLSADYVIGRLGELTDHDATLVADVGQHQMWLARYAGFRRPDSHLSSGGLGTMGYGAARRDGRGPRSAGQGDLGGRRRRRLPDDHPGDADGRRRPHPGEDRAHGQQEAGDDPPVAGDHLRRQLPLAAPAGPDW